MEPYYNGFFLSPTDGNMLFAQSPQPLRVAPLLSVKDFAEVKKNMALEEEKFAFAEKDENQKTLSFHGLKNFLCREKSPSQRIYLFDNHNHALFFRYQEYLTSRKICKVIHIDQHSDLWENQFSLPDDLLAADRSPEVFQFTQKYCNVGNFLPPALKSGLISEVIQIRSESVFFALRENFLKESYILDIDLDFWAPEMSIDLQKCLPQLKLIAENAVAVTIATSPYFLEQKKALQMVEEILLFL
jgi:hypothetical protein